MENMKEITVQMKMSNENDLIKMYCLELIGQ